MICVSVYRLSSEGSAYVPSRIKKLLSFEVFFVVAIRIENQASKGGPRTAPGSVRDSDKISHSDWSCQTRVGTVSRCVTDEQALWNTVRCRVSSSRASGGGSSFFFSPTQPSKSDV